MLNFVTGPGSSVGETILSDARVKMISFTGESKTGKRIAEANSQFLRKQLLELGGKNPVIVAKDADLSFSVNAVLYAAFSNCGQKCTAASRVIVEKPIRDAFVRKFVEGARKLRVGDGLKPGVQVGPLITHEAREKVEHYVKLGQDEGARVLTGGHEYSDAERSKGNFFEPTVFDEVKNQMKIAQDEIFGPVVAIIEAEDTEHAIEIANDTRYGLSSAIYTRDIRNAFRSLSKIQSGMGYVNQGTTGAEVHLPFGGVKESGFGREAGEVAIENYTEKKAVYVDYSYKNRPWYIRFRVVEFTGRIKTGFRMSNAKEAIFLKQPLNNAKANRQVNS